MTSRFRADVELDATPNNAAVFQAVATDSSYYDGPDSVDVSLDGSIRITVSANRLAHLRAGLNSALRLAKAGNDAVESVKL